MTHINMPANDKSAPKLPPPPFKVRPTPLFDIVIILDLFTSVALHAELDSFTQLKTFICVSTVMTWAKSKPVDEVTSNRNKCLQISRNFISKVEKSFYLNYNIPSTYPSLCQSIAIAS